MSALLCRPCADAGRSWRPALRTALLLVWLSALGAGLGATDEPNYGYGPQGRRLSPWGPVARTGDQRLLVILTEFSDRACTRSGAAWAQRFFGDGGFAEFYRQNSFGQLRYHGDVVGMTAGGVPVVNSSGVECLRLPQTLEYYAGGQYGYDITRCSRRNHGGIYHDALAALDAAGFDFAPYSDPATKQVSNIVVIASAQSYHIVQNKNASLLSTAYELRYIFSDCPGDTALKVDSGGRFVSSQGFSANAYTFCTGHTYDAENLPALGPCIHEQGHALGNVDLYGVGQYSLMGVGAWGPVYKGDYPSHLGAFDKVLFGWVMPTAVRSSQVETEFVLRPSHKHPDMLKLSINNSEEYYLVENRQELAYRGPAAKGLVPDFCPGVLIWHVDGAIARPNAKYWFGNSVNDLDHSSPPPHRGVTVREADADGSLPQTSHECDDTHRLGSGVFAGECARLWDGTDSGITLRVLTAPDGDGAVRVAVRCTRCPDSGELGSTTTARPGGGGTTAPPITDCSGIPEGLADECDGNSTPPGSRMAFDCAAGAEDWRALWPTSKIAFCCERWQSACGGDGDAAQEEEPWNDNTNSAARAARGVAWLLASLALCR